ncbi:MAG: BMP family ABC transporter substrate-binding protein [Nitriliruptoraceae bacterium]|nr:BMP family ABC transporter substrate-binding protein [Nitriliruptoraceae bacterium]
MRISRWKTLPLLLAIGLIATACGGNGDTDEPADTDTDTTEDADDADEDADADADEDADDESAADGDPVSVGLLLDLGGRGDESFNDAAAAGVDQASSEFNLEVTELEPNEAGENRDELARLLSQEGAEIVIAVGFLFEEAIGAVSPDFPDVNYGLVDALVEQDNVAGLLFAEHEGSFLVGAAAALKTETGRVGFIGGVENPLIERFEAGFNAGVAAVDPDIEIDRNYISQPPDFSGFNDPARGREIALGMYGNGADIIYHAAGGSGSGLFEAAREVSEDTGSQVWAIGVDSDQYLTADEALQPYILTSMLKRVDVAVYQTIAAHIDGSFAGGPQEFDLAVDGVGYSTSGGFIDDIVDQLEEFKEQIASGAIDVPNAL